MKRVATAFFLTGITLAGALWFGGIPSASSAENLVNQEIYVINVDGSNLVNLTQTQEADESAPTWSPDGKKIAFRSSGEGGGLMTMDRDGRNVTRLVDWPLRFAWSPDGKKIAFTDAALKVVNSDGRSQTELVSGFEISISAEAWSPDSKRIAFSGYPFSIKGSPMFSSMREFHNDRETTNASVYTVDINRSAITQVTNLPTDPNRATWTTLPSWSPDGRWIAFSSGYGLPSAVPALGGILVMLGHTGEVGKSLVNSKPGSTLLWSSDSKKLVWEGIGVIYAIDIGTNAVTSITTGRSPALSPDGDKIAFVRDENIYIKDLHGGTETALTVGGYPVWSPDGKRIAFVKAVVASAPEISGFLVGRPLIPTIMADGSMAWDGGDFIYASSGSFGNSSRAQSYYRYSISEDSWVSLPSDPCGGRFITIGGEV